MSGDPEDRDNRDGPRAPAAPPLSGIDHLVLTVADPDRTIAFYARALGMTAERFRATDGSARMALRVARQKINLHVAGSEYAPHAGSPTPGSADLCLLTEADIDTWARHLAAAGVPTVAGPVPRTGARGPLVSLYIRDPDGNLIEIAQPAR